MNNREENEIEIEICKYSDINFFYDKCLKCKNKNLKRFTHKMREILDLGIFLIRCYIRYEYMNFQCKKHKEIFTIEHLLVSIGYRYICVKNIRL